MSPSRTLITHSSIFLGLPGDLNEFKSIVKSLSRTATLLLCAKLGAQLGFRLHEEESVFQLKFAELFLSVEERSRLPSETPLRLVFRGQLLELMRWVVALSADKSNDADFFVDPTARRAFARALLMASEAWVLRVYAEDFESDGTPKKQRPERSLQALRQAELETTRGPHPFFGLARGELMANHMRNLRSDVEQVFRDKVGMSIDDYFVVLACVASIALGRSIEQLNDPVKCGFLDFDSLVSEPEPMGPLMREYFDRESFGTEELGAAFGINHGLAPRVGEALSLTRLRRTPIWRRNRWAIAIDSVFLAERAIAGPLFHLVPGEANADAYFSAFGKAFEIYASEVMSRIFPAMEDRLPGPRFVFNPAASARANQNVELADGLLIDGEACVFFEYKVAWLREDRTQPTTSNEVYWEHVRERYGVSVHRDGKARVKGVGQLARSIRQVAEGTWQPSVEFGSIRSIIPVLVVHDVSLDAPAHANFLAREFCRELTGTIHGDLLSDDRFGKFQVADLIVLTIEDLEFLEGSRSSLCVRECLEEYDRTCRDRMTSFYNFLFESRFRPNLRFSQHLSKCKVDLFTRCLARLYPNGPPSDANGAPL